jgi:hypothetical protein
MQIKIKTNSVRNRISDKKTAKKESNNDKFNLQKDSIFYESRNPAILRWLRPLEENNDLTTVHNDSTLPSKTTKQLISDIRCFQGKLTPDYVKKYDIENYCQETQDYLSL